MREGPLAELFKATEAAQRQAEREGSPEGDAAASEGSPTLEQAMTMEARESRAEPKEPHPEASEPTEAPAPAPSQPLAPAARLATALAPRPVESPRLSRAPRPTPPPISLSSESSVSAAAV